MVSFQSHSPHCLPLARAFHWCLGLSGSLLPRPREREVFFSPARAFSSREAAGQNTTENSSVYGEALLQYVEIHEGTFPKDAGVSLLAEVMPHHLYYYLYSC